MAAPGYDSLAQLYDQDYARRQQFVEMDAHNNLGALDTSQSFFGAMGNALYGKEQFVRNPYLLNQTAADYDARNALAQRQAAEQTLGMMQRQALSPSNVANVQQQQALMAVNAQRNAATQAGMGSGRGLVAMQAAGLGQAQAQQARSQALASQLEQLRAAQSGFGQLAAGDLDSRRTAYEAAKADQDEMLAVLGAQREATSKDAAEEQKNAGKFFQTMGAAAMGGGIL